MSADLAYLPLAEQARAIAARELSSTELTRLYLGRIEALDGDLNSYLRVDADLAAGHDVGALAGVPLGLKDIFVTRGVETTAASKILAGWIPPYDGTAVARLRGAGAVILGKLNMDEFAMGSSNEASAFGPCRNPWDRTRVPGGSSGGSAAAVAAGLCAASLGTDTGGSIRQPASMCGVVGIKPTYGRVSRYGVIAFASSLDQVGPLTRTVEDAALVLECIAGIDPHDATSIDAPVPRYRDALTGDVRGLRVGLPREYFAADIDPEIAAAIDRGVDTLRGLGCEISEVSLPNTEHALPVYYLVAPAEASSNLARYDGVRFGSRVCEPGDSLLDLYRKTRGAGFGPEVKRRIMLGTFALRSGYYDAYYRKAQQVRALIKADFDRVFEQVDVVLGPTTPSPAFELGAKTASPLDMYLADIFTLSCNLAGLPGLSVPCGFTAGGLPIGLQVMGKPLDEETVLRIGHAFEAATGFAARRPSLPGASA